MSFAIGVWAFVRHWDDFGNDPFLVGAMLGPDDSAILFIGDCVGGHIEHLDLAVDATDGVEPFHQWLWAIDAGDDEGAPLEPDDVVEVELGVAPQGMDETVALDQGIPSDETLQVDIDTTGQSFGFFFRLDDLDGDGIWSVGRDSLSPDRFRSRVESQCN